MDHDFTHHQPVLLDTTIQKLISDSEGIYIDCTLGFGGHTSKILSRLSSRGQILCFDQDSNAIDYCRNRFEKDSRVRIFQNNFRSLKTVVKAQGLQNKINGILFDLGLSSFQIDNPEKGFSFQSSGPLDMRFGCDTSMTAFDIINHQSQHEIADIIYQYGEERQSRKIAKKIIESRKIKEISTTDELTKIIRSVSNNVKTLARVFQALRIAVNDEMNALEEALKSAKSILKTHGRIVVISYHSLEDRIVKHFFRQSASSCVCPSNFPICQCNKSKEMKIITRKPIIPTKDEITNNVRARSAKLRVAEKI